MSMITELKNEQATALIADLIEPAAEIFADEDFKDALKEDKLKAVKLLMKNHGEALLTMLAILDGVPRKDYSVNAVDIIKKSLAVLNDKELLSAFTLQEQTVES